MSRALVSTPRFAFSFDTTPKLFTQLTFRHRVNQDYGEALKVSCQILNS